jgi:hypothetical protein
VGLTVVGACHTNQKRGRGGGGGERIEEAGGRKAMPGAGWDARGTKHLGCERFFFEAHPIPLPVSGTASDLLFNLRGLYGINPRGAPGPVQRTCKNQGSGRNRPKLAPGEMDKTNKYIML